MLSVNSNSSSLDPASFQIIFNIHSEVTDYLQRLEKLISHGEFQFQV